ncbi:MAG TPA: 1-acyl-sn-glycerol-3-phosphate acyltransferase [Solirubrobacteraceae bacterium]|nr:1-acyl-sn-glycerol-3-phosphate acyltransferase [Solirubrobacteraceae bacterium]
MGPLISDDGSPASRWLRRTRGVVLELLLFVAVTVLLPLALGIGAVVDLVLWLRSRKPWMAVRLVALAWWFLAGELYGLAGLLAIQTVCLGRDGPRRRRLVFALKRQWLGSHVAWLRRLFGLRFEFDGLELAGPGPVLVMIRHASIIDNALPDVIIGGAHGIGFRFVIKRELRMLPTIDIGGRWVPTLFVRRASGDTAAELAKLEPLTERLGPGDGVLIYPEGTRCTAEKLARAKAVIAARQPEVAPLAQSLRHVLPPRLGGVLTLLERSRDAVTVDGSGVDVVVFGHVGLDGFEYISDIWSGGLVGTTVRMKFWRYPASEIPTDREALIRWLYGIWQTLDDWIGEWIADGDAPRKTAPHPVATGA